MKNVEYIKAAATMLAFSAIGATVCAITGAMGVGMAIQNPSIAREAAQCGAIGGSLFMALLTSPCLKEQASHVITGDYKVKHALSQKITQTAINWHLMMIFASTGFAILNTGNRETGMEFIDCVTAFALGGLFTAPAVALSLDQVKHYAAEAMNTGGEMAENPMRLNR